MDSQQIVKGPPSEPIPEPKITVPDTVGGGGDLAKKIREFNQNKENTFDTMKKKEY
jgi:hypothetical protein